MAERRDEYVALRFALPPLLVWALSQVLFEQVAFDLGAVVAQVSGALAARGASTEVAPALEASARILWAGSLLLFIVVAAAVLVYAVWLTLSRLSRAASKAYATLALLLCAVSLAHAALSSETRNAFSMLYFFTMDGLRACRCYTAAELGVVDAAVTVLNALAATVPPVALVAGCSVLVLPRDDGAQALALMQRRMAQLKTLLTGGSALLVSGLVHQFLWQRWPVVLAGGEGGLLRFVESMSVYWGATYSLLIVAFYVPPAWIIHRRARAILEREPALAGGDDPEVWLGKHDLSRAALHRIPQLAAMLAPLLAGPIGAGLSALGDGLASG